MAIASQSHCNRSALTSQLQHRRSAIAASSQRNRNCHPNCNRINRITIASHHNRIAIAVQSPPPSHRNYIASQSQSQSQRNRITVESQSQRNLIAQLRHNRNHIAITS
jgi:hypothetical protein